MDKELKSIIEEAVEEYNLYRRPEAEAEISGFEDERFTITFRGPFCRSCGVYDYFEDLIYYILKKRRVNLEIVKIEDAGDERFQVRYMVK